MTPTRAKELRLSEIRAKRIIISQTIKGLVKKDRELELESVSIQNWLREQEETDD